MGKNSTERAENLNDIGNVYRNMGKYESAIDFYKDALAIYDYLGITNSLYHGIVKTLKNTEDALKSGTIWSDNSKFIY